MRHGVLILGSLAALLSACGPTVPATTRPAMRPAASTLGLEPGQRALGHFLKGEVAQQRGDRGRALAEFEAAAELDPTVPRLRTRLARLHVLRGDLDSALEHAERAVLLQPTNVEAQELLAGVLSGLGRSDDSRRAYQRVIDIGPGRPEPYLVLSAQHGGAGDELEARKVLERLVRSNPNSVMGFYYLGRLHAVSGSLEDAEANFEEALKRNPRSTPVILDLGTVKELQGRRNDARDLYRKVLSFDPDNRAAALRLANEDPSDPHHLVDQLSARGRTEIDPVETRLKIALIQLERGQFEDAAIHLSLVLPITENRSRVHYYLGIVLTEGGDDLGAREQLGQVHPDSRYYADAQLQLAYLAQRAGDLAGSADHANRALQKQPAALQIMEFLVALERERGRTEEAIILAEKLVASHPENDRFQFTLGALRDETHDRPTALRHMRRAIDLNPRNASALNYLGYCLAEEGRNLDEAEHLILRALSLQPNDGFFVDSLGWVYYQRGNYHEAVEHLERAAELTGDDNTINEHLADAYRKVGRDLEALRLYREALKSVADEAQRRRLQSKVRAAERADKPADRPL